MPFITVHTTPLTKEQKNRILVEFTRVTSEVTGFPQTGVFVIFNEVKSDDIGFAGVQLSEMLHQAHR